MAEVVVKVPKDIEAEFSDLLPSFWQLVVGRAINEELERLVLLKKIARKSRLTDKDVEELSDKVNRSLSERYRRMYVKG